MILLPEQPPDLECHSLSSSKGWLDTMRWPKARLQEPNPTVSLAFLLVPAHFLADEVTSGQKERCSAWAQAHQKGVSLVPTEQLRVTLWVQA